jgi:hypothetical protein
MRKRKDKNPNNAATRKLAQEWAAMVEAHSLPLERGAKAKGVDTTALTVKAKPLLSRVTARTVENLGYQIQSVRMNGAATKSTPTPELAAAMKHVAGRTGAAYNKGGLQYLTDDELAEHRTGAHKRR